MMHEDDRPIIDNFYQTVDTFIRLLGPEQVSRTEVFFRLSRAAIGADIDYSELQRIVGRITSFQTWYSAWRDSADHFVHIAQRAQNKGHAVTAGENYLRAAHLYHFAQLFTRPEDPHRQEGQRRRVAYYHKAAPLLMPPVEIIEIPHDMLRMPGYLRLPLNHTEPTPVAIMIPGANSVKEELHQWGAALVKRGIATLMVDGPGQGELSVRNGGVPLRLESYHQAVSAMIDYVEARAELNHEQVILWGQSTGGNFVLGAAGRDHRAKAVVALAGGYDFRRKSATTTPADVREEARDLYGLASFAELSSYVQAHGSLQGIIEQIQCPILLIHGGQDGIVAPEEIEQIRQEATVPTDLLFYEDGNHSVCNHNLEMRAAMADWVVDRIQVSSST